MLYRWLIRPLLWALPAETAHRLAFGALRLVVAVPGVGAALRALSKPRDEVLVVRAFGRDMPSPIGVAAGFDKNAEGVDALGALGFSVVEIGTVTARAQPGNPRPRLFRLPPDRALINRMGFNNEGADRIRARLARRGHTIRPRVGVNIGKTKTTPPEQSIEDYVETTEKLAPYADYLVVNVSSPNTPGLRALQSVNALRPLLQAVSDAAKRATQSRHVPLLVKIAPDLADEDIDAVADLALELGIDGIIATNTTVSRDGLRTEDRRVEACGVGGLSGPPLRARALEVLRRLRTRTGDQVTLIGVGGIESAEDAWARIRAGATMVQLYTAFIYQGPGLARRLGPELARIARRHGYARVQDAVGADLTDGRAPNADSARA